MDGGKTNIGIGLPIRGNFAQDWYRPDGHGHLFLREINVERMGNNKDKTEATVFFLTRKLDHKYKIYRKY